MKTIKLPKEFADSAISAEIFALNFTEIPESYDPENCEEADLLLYGLPDSDRKNGGMLREGLMKIYSSFGGGWWCATLNPDGTPSPWGCFKPRNPRKNADGKIIKYETPPKVPTQPFFLRVDRQTWGKIAVNAGVQCPDLEGLPDESIPHEFWSWVISRPEIPIIITEGAKKTASLLSVGVCAVGLSGIWNGIRAIVDPVKDQKTGDHELIPQLLAIAQKGREFTFCFDMDDKPKTKQAVRVAMVRTAALLARQTGKKFFYEMRWDDAYPGIKGIDDLLAEKGEQEFWTIYDRRPQRKIVTKKVGEARQREEQLLREGLAAAMGDRIENLLYGDISPTDYSNGNGNGDGKALSKDEINELYRQKLEFAEATLKRNDPQGYAEVIAKTSTPLQPVTSYIDDPEPDAPLLIDEDEEEPEKPPALTYQEIALDHVFGKGHFISLQYSPSNWVLFEFNGKFYEPAKPSAIRKKIRDWASKYWVKDPKTKRKTLKYLTTAAINEIYKYALLVFEQDLRDCNPDGFNLDNGVLRIKWDGNTPTWRLYPHSPKDFFMSCSPVKYDPNADPQYCEKLLQCLDPLPRDILLRNLSAIFDIRKILALRGRSLRAGFCVGRGANGKDSIRNILTHIFGDRMCSISLSEFIAYDKGDKKALKELETAKLNWSSENNQETPIDKIEILNALISGEQGVLWVEDKWVTSRRVDDSSSIHLFNCNNTPIIKSGLTSLESRFVVYDFNKTFVPNPNPHKGELQADPRFHDDFDFQIQKVAPALLNVLLEKFALVAKEGIDYSEISKGLKGLQEASTHLWSFVQDVGLAEEKEGKVYVSNLWEKLEAWYIENGTLEKTELYDGTFKKVWNEQPIRFDPNITSPNQVFKRLQKLFPNITKERESQDPVFKGKFFIKGITLNPASLLHSPCNTSTFASPSASLPFTGGDSSSLPSISSSSSSDFVGEAKSEGKSEAESLAVSDGEAVKQNSPFSSNADFSSKTLAQLAGDRQPLPPVPEDLARLGYKWSVGQILKHKDTSRYVCVIAYPGIGSPRVAKEYICQFLDGDESQTNIRQQDLKEV